MLLNKYYVIVLQIKITSLFLKKYVSVTTSRAESTKQGVRERRGVGNTKISVTIPRGVHAARQKHAPCVGLTLKQRSNTTEVGESHWNEVERIDDPDVKHVHR